MKIDWQEEYESLVRSIGSLTYGKERWFYESNGIWYDRKYGENISTLELHNRIIEEIGEAYD